MSDDINDTLGAGNGDDQEPVARSFLSPEEVEERVAVFRASLVRLDQDPAEAARIDRLLAETNAVLGSGFAFSDDPPEIKPILDDARQGGASIVINGNHAQPRIAVDHAGHDGSDCGFSLVINGDHAEPRIQVGADQPGQEDDHLAQEREEFLNALKEMRAWAGDRRGRKPAMMRGRGAVAVAFLAGAGAAMAISSAAIAQIVAITALAVAPALLLLVIIMPAIFSAQEVRRKAAFSVLRLLLNGGLRPEDPPWAGRSGQRLALGGREAGRADQ